jgi:integrase
MPSGACVIRYPGKRGVVWYTKYRDSEGKQVKERLGSAAEGWTKRKAEAALRGRLTDVERDGYRKPERVTFASFAREWVAAYPDRKGLKRSTRRGYAGIVEGHLVPFFGAVQLHEVDVEAIEGYVASKRKSGLSAATVNRHLNVVSLILKAARRRGLVRDVAVALVDRPRERRRRWRILSPVEVAAVEAAFAELGGEAESDRDRDDLVVARRLFLVHMGAGLRRGEAAGLRWRSVFLADPLGAYLRVEESFVRDAVDTPKSEAGRRTIDLGRRLADELFDHRAWSAYDGDDDYVFANPRSGRPFQAGRYSALMKKALKKAGIVEYLRPSHDLRHSSITNAARAGASPEALMTRAGHSDYATTRIYINLAGERFREEADRLEERLWGATGTKSRYQDGASSPAEATEVAD